MHRPWTFADVRSVLLAILLWHAFVSALVWVAAERTTVNRIRAEAECPAGKPFKRVLWLNDMRVDCHYLRQQERRKP